MSLLLVAAQFGVTPSKANLPLVQPFIRRIGHCQNPFDMLDS